MIGVDKDALLCDLAETYHIYGFDQVDLVTTATLAAGLHEDSRIKRKISGFNEIPATFTLVHIADALTVLLSTLAGEKKKPVLYYDALTGKQKVEHKGGFKSIEDFEAARQRFIHG